MHISNVSTIFLLFFHSQSHGPSEAKEKESDQGKYKVHDVSFKSKLIDEIKTIDSRSDCQNKPELLEKIIDFFWIHL